MIDPKAFISAPSKSSTKFKEIDGTFSCSEQGCFEVSTKGMYDASNKKVYWTCPNGHDGSARLVYE
jgi:hypothetical protein